MIREGIEGAKELCEGTGAALPYDRVRGKEVKREGLDGLGSVPGSSRNRRPRIAAPNPTSHSETGGSASPWLGRHKLRVPEFQYDL